MDHKYPLKMLNVLEYFESIGFDEERTILTITFQAINIFTSRQNCFGFQGNKIDKPSNGYFAVKKILISQ